jgi:hypothetical protein
LENVSSKANYNNRKSIQTQIMNLSNLIGEQQQHQDPFLKFGILNLKNVVSKFKIQTSHFIQYRTVHYSILPNGSDETVEKKYEPLEIHSPPHKRR